MGYKVTNKNVVVNRDKNTALDNVFFFRDIVDAEEYILDCVKFHASTGKDVPPPVLEKCTPEEDEKYLFSQYHEEFNANGMKLPNIVIERPITIEPGLPYWVRTSELLISD